MTFARFVIGIGLMVFPMCLMGLIRITQYEKGRTTFTSEQYLGITAATIMLVFLLEIFASGIWLLLWGGQQ